MFDVLPQILLNGVIAASLYALVALGFNLIFKVTKFFNLAHGAVAVVGGYSTLFFINTFSWHWFPAILAGITLAAIVGLLTDITVFKPLRKRKASTLVLLVASLGLYIILQSLIAIGFSSQFQTLAAGAEPTVRMLGGVVTRTQILIFFVSLGVYGALEALLKFTRFGKALKAVSDDAEVARVVGINTNTIITWTFVIGSAIAGLAGILNGFDTGIEPTMGLVLIMKGAIAAVIGGLGNSAGSMLGALILGVVENIGIWQLSSEWKDAIAFGLLILFMIFKPEGLMNKRR